MKNQDTDFTHSILKSPLINEATYKSMYQQSVTDPSAFWKEHGNRLDWMVPYTKVKDVSFKKDDFHIRWFYDGLLNVAANCLDRHLQARGDQAAIIWEGDAPGSTKTITYQALYDQVCRFANALKKQGIVKGDRVTIYMPMIPEAVVAMLACARLGAIHSVVFAGFSSEALAERIQDCGSSLVITADQGVRGGKVIPLKEKTDAALLLCPDSIPVVVIKRTGAHIDWNTERNHWYHELVENESTDCPAEAMNAEDPLFILYTSGSTGKPKGVVHSSGGYLVYASMTHEYVFDCKPGDVYWCTADIGWITGHSYSVYGPLANGVTTVIYEGVPTYPTAARCWETCDKHQVSVFYTAPTVIRGLMKEGDAPLNGTQRTSLRILGTVGEPINPDAWLWYYHQVGQSKCPIVDTWWQTETGGIMITPLPGVTDLKPGAAASPFFGIVPEIVNDDGQVLEGEARGSLCIGASWPGQMRGVYRDPNKFYNTYFSQFSGKFFTGDGCYRDKNGCYWMTGRLDDVINVSGHRLSTAEIESALDAHPLAVEAAVVSCPHEIKGEGIYAYVSLKKDATCSDAMKSELIQLVKQRIGAFAAIDFIQWSDNLPKTRSGKIMRRILKKIANNDCDSLGDTSTLEQTAIVDQLIENRQNRERKVDSCFFD